MLLLHLALQGNVVQRHLLVSSSSDLHVVLRAQPFVSDLLQTVKR